MSMERPMNEYEGALFAGIMTLIKAITCLGADRISLAGQFRESASVDKEQGLETAAAVNEMFAKIAETDNFYLPKPPFHVIKGGKDNRTPE